MEHALTLVDPYGHASVSQLLDGAVDGHEGGGTVVLGPVELDAARNPGACKSDKRGLDYMVVVYEVAVAYLVVGHLHASSELREYHHLDVFVLNPYGVILYVGFRIGNRFDDGIGVDYAR